MMCLHCRKGIPKVQVTKFREAIEIIGYPDGYEPSPETDKNDPEALEFDRKTSFMLASMTGAACAWRCDRCEEWICHSCLEKAKMEAPQHDNCKGTFRSPVDWVQAKLSQKKWWQFWK